MKNGQSLSGTLTEDDYVAAQRLHLRAWRKRQRAVLGIVAALGIAVMTLGHFLPGSFLPGAILPGAILFGAGAGGFLGEMVLYKRNWPRAWRRLFEQQKTLHEPLHYTWDEAGLHVSTPLAHAVRPWSYFIKRIEDAETLLVYHSDAMFELIPKRWFEGARVPASLEALLLRHVGPPRRSNPTAPVATEQRLS